MAEKRNSLFEKYRSRVVREGVLKAVFCGLIIGFAVFIVSAAALWFTGVTWGIWLSLALFLVCTGISVPIFYYAKFKPTAKAIAKRIDKLGLEERILTMMELENDQSFIAMKQREDAVQALKTADHIRFPSSACSAREWAPFQRSIPRASSPAGRTFCTGLPPASRQPIPSPIRSETDRAIYSIGRRATCSTPP